MDKRMTMVGRRDFLKTTATGLGGFAYLSASLTRPPDAPDKFEGTRVLGRTGFRLPIVSMGVMNTDNPQLVRAALDAGYVFLDTAQGYQRGTNEAMLGEILKDRPRDSFVIATKASLPKDQTTGGYGPDATEEAYTKKKDFLGYGFLHSGFTADYDRSGHTYQLFVIAGNGPDEARAMLGQYLKQIKHEAPVVEGAYQVTDPYHGAMALLWKGKYIWGTIHVADPGLRTAYLKYFEGLAIR